MHMKKKIETNFFCKSNHWPKRMIKIKEIVKNILFVQELGFQNKNYYFLNLIFLDDKSIKKINKIYRKINKSTDVLTFVESVKFNKIKNEFYCDIFFSAETIISPFFGCSKRSRRTSILSFSFSPSRSPKDCSSFTSRIGSCLRPSADK